MEGKKLIGWVIKSKKRIDDSKYNIEPNEEFEIVNAIDRKIIVCDIKGNEYYIDLDCIRKNFELVCELS